MLKVIFFGKDLSSARVTVCKVHFPSVVFNKIFVFKNTTTINGRVPGRREGGGGARVSGFANVRTIDHSAPATGG